MSKRIYNTLRGSGEPTKAMAIQSGAIRRRMKRLKETGHFTSDEINRMKRAAYSKMYSDLGLLPEEYRRAGIDIQLQQDNTEVNEQTVESEKNKTKIRTILWP